VDPTVQTFSILLILLTFVVLTIGAQFVRRKRAAFPIRAIAAYQAISDDIGLAIERGRGVHVSFGSAGLGGSTTLWALVTNELLYQISQRASVAGVTPVATMSDPTAVPLAYGTLQAALRQRGLSAPRSFDPAVQWYAGGPGGRSLAFAAILTGVMAHERMAFNALAGSFGAELALPLLAAQRAGAVSLATSDQVEGQAVAWVMSERPLLGEELYAAGAYLSDRSSALGGVIAQDALRWVVIAALLIPTVLAVGDALTGGAITRLLAGLLSGGS
jgi:hypothetical protein